MFDIWGARRIVAILTKMKMLEGGKFKREKVVVFLIY